MKFKYGSRLVNIALVLILTIGVINYFPSRALAADHPGNLHSQTEIDAVKLNIQQNIQPWKDAFDELIVKANESLSHVSQAVQNFYAPGYYSDPDASIAAKTLIHEDGSAAYFCALAYQLDESSNRTQYADKAVELLNSWAAINETVSGTDGNEYMITGGIGLIQAADLVWNYSGWNSTDRDDFAVWVSNVFQNCGNALKDRNPNLGSWGTWGSISAACLVEDQTTIDADINLMKNKIENIIASDGHMPYDTQYEGKGIWYTYYGLAPLTAAFQVVLNATGTDLFHYTSPSGHNIKMALDNLFYYSQHPDEWPYYGEVTNMPSTDSWPGNLFMAMAGIYDETEYSDWVTSSGTLYDSTWWSSLHIAWYFPVLMQPLTVPDTTPPVSYNGQPTGSLPYGTTQTTISLTTDEAATCKYSTTPGTSYDSMTNTFSTTGGTSHSTLITGLSDGGSYTYYIKCADTLGNQNTTDYAISFSVESEPTTNENRTQIEPLVAFSTIENISVMAPFVYDDNENNSALLEYREYPGGIWQTAIEWTPGDTMWCDRRAYVESFRIGGEVPQGGPWSDPQPNPFYPQEGGTPVDSGGLFKATIFFLTPDTNYQIRVTFTDPDGITGTNPLTTTLRTKDDTPPLTGTNYYVSTTGSDSNNGLSPSNAWTTIQHAADTVQAGGIVNILPGTYRGGVTCYDNAGTENNYITFRSYDMNNKAVIDCEGIDQWAFRWKVPYLRFSGLVVKNTANVGALFWANGESVTDLSTGVIIEDCDIINWGNSWPSSGVYLPYVDGAIIQRNNFTRDIATISASNYGVMFINRRGDGDRTNFDDQCRNCVVKENNFIGCMQDFVGGSGEGMNSHVYNNYGEGAKDDAWSLDLWGVCCSGWGNTGNGVPNLSSGNAFGMAVSIAPITVGPVYVFRNTSWGHRSGATKVGARSHGRVYIYNNTFVTEGGSGPLAFGDDNQVDNQVYMNNIYEVSNPMSLGASTGDPVYETWQMEFDYNCWTQSGTFFLPEPSKTTLGLDYPDTWATDRIGYTFSQFQALAAQYPNHLISSDQHGFVADPLLTDPENLDFRLQSGSPCIDMAMLVPGLNDANSPWPYSGSGPDMGAIEYDSGPAVDNNPPYTIGHNPAKGATSIARDTNIVVNVRDNGAGVDQSSIVMTVEGVTVTPTITGTPANYTVTYDPPSDFDFSQVVNVTVDARDLASSPHVMTQDAYSFTIASSTVDNTPPTFYSVSASNVSGTSTCINWTTDEGSTSQVEYWASPLESSELNEELVTDHLVTLNDLSPSTTYSYRVLSADAAGNLAISEEGTFTTNYIPTVYDDSVVTDEDRPITVTVLTNDFDSDGEILTVTHVSQPYNGSVTLNTDQTVTYYPNENFNGFDYFTYYVSDSIANSDIAFVTITVQPVNDPPIANNDYYECKRGISVTIDVIANDIDIDSDSLIISDVTQGINGGVIINSEENTITYTPTTGFVGVDTFTYIISDGESISSPAVVTIGDVVNSISLDIATGADDATETTREAVSTSTELKIWSYPGTTPWQRTSTGLRFQSVDIPQGATIVASYISIYPFTTDANDINCNIYLANTGNAGDFVSNPHIINETYRPRTTYYTPWVQDNLDIDTYVASPSLNMPLQELVNRPDWTAGNDMVVLMIADEDIDKLIRFWHQENWHNLPVKLHIEYVLSDVIPPVAEPGGPYTGITGSPVSFDGTGSYDPDGTIVAYDWDFGDGSAGTGATPTHTYTSDDTYTVTLTVTDDDGVTNTSITVTTIISENADPVSEPDGPYTGVAGSPVSFDGTGSYDPDGSIVDFDWDFGDGATGIGATPTHTYAVDGTYTITLTVTDDDGATDTAATTIEISDTPPADLTITSISPSQVTEGGSIDVTIYGSGFENSTIVSLGGGSGPTPKVTIKIITETSISATITTKTGGPPKIELRSWDIRVTNTDSSTAVLEDGFTVYPKPK